MEAKMRKKWGKRIKNLEEINGVENGFPWVETGDITNKFENIFQRLISQRRDPKGTVTFFTPSGGILRAFNHEKGVLFNLDDVSQMLERGISNIDIAKDSYGYIPYIGESMHINAGRLFKEMGRINHPFPENYEFVLYYVKPYMEDPRNFLEEGTKLYIPSASGVIVGVIELAYKDGMDVTYNVCSGNSWYLFSPSDIETEAFLSYEACVSNANYPHF